jgi:integrase
MAELKDFDKSPVQNRRALEPDEIRRLLGVASPERRLLYAVASVTGLRKGELKMLTVADLDTVNGGLSLSAEWTKNRKSVFQPLPDSVLSELQKSTQGKLLSDPLLEVPLHTARELYKDLKAAQIPQITPEGKMDFHALRTTFTTLVIESGANVKEAQTLLRHSTPSLTMELYARARGGRLADLADSVAGRIGFSQMDCQNSVKTQVVGLDRELNNTSDRKNLEKQEKGEGRRFESYPRYRRYTSASNLGNSNCRR